MTSRETLFKSSYSRKIECVVRLSRIRSIQHTDVTAGLPWGYDPVVPVLELDFLSPFERQRL